MVHYDYWLNCLLLGKNPNFRPLKGSDDDWDWQDENNLEEEELDG